MTIRGVDLKVDEDGDLVVGDNGDLALATPVETIVQDIIFRIRTQHNDYELDPLIGANINIFLGEPNTRRNGDLIKEQVYHALTRDNRLRRPQFNVEVVPVGMDTVLILVIITDRIDQFDGNNLLINFTFNYRTGQIDRIA